MIQNLCITIRFLQPFPLFHGRGDAGRPEWPPSPMRLFQALVNAASLRTRGQPLAAEVRQALQTIESIQPQIFAPRAIASAVGHRAYVPHNQTDLVTAAWHRGNLDASIASHRIEKDYRPMRIETLDDGLPTLCYLYPFDAIEIEMDELLQAIRPSVRSITHLGWGIDQVVADATFIDSSIPQSSGERWVPSPAGGRRLRTHRRGSLDALMKRHGQFLTRLQEGWTPVPPLTDNDVEHVRYRRDTDPLPRPCVVFKLVDENDDTAPYAHDKLIHISGMVRHLAIKKMKQNPPTDLRGIDAGDWVRAYVAGHQSQEEKNAGAPHSQFSYIPLPSIGHQHTDPAIRRVMIVAPIGDEAWLDHLAQQINGQLLEPLPNTTLPPGAHLQLIPDNRKDGVRDAYLGGSNVWASFTPVILPGHDDHRPAKTQKLILKALAQSGIDQECEFEWSPFPFGFRKALTAHKYGRDKRPSGYIRPNHLLHQTAIHLKITFKNGVIVPGPLTIGAGRHCGFGLMASIRE